MTEPTTSAAERDWSESQTERRRHHRVRAIFEEASVLIKPFFSSDNQWGSASLELLAYRTVRERYPELSPVEVHVLVTACRRVFTGVRG